MGNPVSMMRAVTATTTAAICSSPSRWRQRVSDERSNGSSCRNTTSPQKYWKYGFSTHRSHSASSERLCICLRMNSPATSRVGNGGCPGPTRHTELKRRARQRISPSKESRTAQIGNPKPQENRHAYPAFLQNRLLAQVKSSRSINRFLILHGRPDKLLIAISESRRPLPKSTGHPENAG